MDVFDFSHLTEVTNPDACELGEISRIHPAKCKARNEQNKRDGTSVIITFKRRT